ncbi:putative apoptosis-inducing factor [Xylariaceae sp. FL1272]|nr:putative apoptosis-inducing factor [Xylariaceae sp. FL1272]
MTRTVVVLGAGQAGLPIAHYLLRNTSKHHSDLKVVLVTPHDAFYHKIASVRFVVPETIPEDKYLFPLMEQFAEYPASKFELVIGSAETLAPETNTIKIRLNGDGKAPSVDDSNSGSLREIPYHTLVIATGSRYTEAMPWKEVGTTVQTKASIAKLQSDIRSAKSIIVAGAGVTGCEFAGELGSAYGKSKQKTITLIGNESLPLTAPIKDSIRKGVQNELAKMNIKYIGNARVTLTSEKGSQTILLTNPDGTTQTLTADLIVPTFGTKPNTSFAPSSMLDIKSSRLTQGPDLRAPGYKNIFILGDAGHLQAPQAVHAGNQTRHLMTNFKSYFSSGEVKPYPVDNKPMIALTLGRDRGAGQMGSWGLPSILVWFLKGRTLGTDKIESYAKGLTDGLGSAWPKS